jgi:hypothetical protein
MGNLPVDDSLIIAVGVAGKRFFNLTQLAYFPFQDQTGIAVQSKSPFVPTSGVKAIVGNKGLRFRLKLFLTGGLFRPHVPSTI